MASGASGDGWEVRTLEVLGRLQLLLVAAGRVGALPASLAGDVRVALGYNQPKDEVLAGTGTIDRWTVLGQAFEEEDRLTVRRTWLHGVRSNCSALVVDFAVGNQPMETSLVPGMAFEGEVVFYPSGSPLRALVKSRGESVRAESPCASDGRHTIAAGLERFARALNGNPWLMRWPLVLPRARVVRAGAQWLIQQGEEVLPLSARFQRGINLWRLLAASGGREVTIAAEWDGESAEPVGVFIDAEGASFVGLVMRWAA
jgi:hypothetical protein